MLIEVGGIGIPGADDYAATWGPQKLPGNILSLWGDRGVVPNGTDAAAWLDQSPAGNDVSQAVPADQPLIVTADPNFNGHTSLRFDGISEFLDRSPATGVPSGEDAPSHWFLVTRYTGATTQSAFSFGNSALGTPRLNQQRTVATWRVNKQDNAGAALNPQIAGGGGPSIIEARIPGTTIDILQDGVGSTALAFNIGVTTLNQIGVGCLAIGASRTLFYAGEFAHIEVFNRALPPGQALAVRSWLQNRYQTPALP